LFGHLGRNFASEVQTFFCRDHVTGWMGGTGGPHKLFVSDQRSDQGLLFLQKHDLEQAMVLGVGVACRGFCFLGKT